MNIKYVNNFGESVNLNTYPYKMLISDIFDYDHEVISNEERIIGFSSEFIDDRTLSIDVHRIKEKTAFQLINDLTDILQKDVLAGVPGRLYVDNWYLKCFFKSRSMERWDTAVIISLEYEICFEKMEWIKEETYYIPAITADIPSKSIYVKNKHFAPFHYILKAYGPFEALEFSIDRNPVKVNAACAEGEYLILNTKNETITKTDMVGNQTNIYSLQDFSLDTFRKISGSILAISNHSTKTETNKVIIQYDRTYDAELIFLLERSEPKWNEEDISSEFFITTESERPLMTEDGFYLIGGVPKGTILKPREEVSL